MLTEKPILYLDVHGVLTRDHPVSKEPFGSSFWFRDQLDPAKILLLKEILETSEAEVVLISDWRAQTHGSTGLMRALVEAGMPVRTARAAILPDKGLPTRGDLIRSTCRTRSWVCILDDQPVSGCERVPHVQPVAGLTETLKNQVLFYLLPKPRFISDEEIAKAEPLVRGQTVCVDSPAAKHLALWLGASILSDDAPPDNLCLSLKNTELVFRK